MSVRIAERLEGILPEGFSRGDKLRMADLVLRFDKNIFIEAGDFAWMSDVFRLCTYTVCEDGFYDKNDELITSRTLCRVLAAIEVQPAREDTRSVLKLHTKLWLRFSLQKAIVRDLLAMGLDAQELQSLLFTAYDRDSVDVIDAATAKRILDSQWYYAVRGDTTYFYGEDLVMFSEPLQMVMSRLLKRAVIGWSAWD